MRQKGVRIQKLLKEKFNELYIKGKMHDNSFNGINDII